MLNAMQLDEYKKARAKGNSPYNALRFARAYPPVNQLEWDDAGPSPLWKASTTETTNEGDVEVTVRIINDEHPDLSWIGEFHNHEVPGSCDWHAFRSLSEWERRRTMKWFRPQFSYDELIQDTRGMSKNDAHLYAMRQVRAQMEQMLEIENGDSLCVGITAIAYLDGVELGEDSCWGFIFNPWDADQWAYINDAASEIIGNAVAMATKNLCPTCRGSGRKAADG